MLRVRQIKVEVTSDSKENLKKALAKKLRIDACDIDHLSIQKQSLDARNKHEIFYVYEVDASFKNEKEILRKRKKLQKKC